MPLPAAVTSARLSLPLWSGEDAQDIDAARRRPDWHPDFPRQDDRDAATLWHAGDPWGPRSIVREGMVVGSIGFFGPPEAGPDGVPEAEVGYGLVEAARGDGVATEALRALLAETDRAGVRVRASVLPDNRPSIRVLAKCGFTELRGSDEEGQLVLARAVRA